MRRRYTTVSGNTGQSPQFTFNAQVISDGAMVRPSVWLAVERYLTGDRRVYSSQNGEDWRELEIFSSGANDFITPTQVLLEACVFGDTGVYTRDTLMGVRIDSYAEEAF